MALTTAQSLVQITDGAGTVLTPANGAIAVVTPAAQLAITLASGTSGINRWEVQFFCPSYPGLHQRSFVWVPGQNPTIYVPLPAEAISGGVLAGVTWVSTVSDGSGGAIPFSTGFLQTRGVPSATGLQQAADYVIVAALPTYTNVNGVLTGNSNGAVTSTMADGATPAVGDVFLLEQGLAGSAVDAGLYQLTAVGAAGAKFSAQALNFGSYMPQKAEIAVGFRGTVFKGTTWVNTLAGTRTGGAGLIGTDSFTFFPRMVTYSAALVSGVITSGATNTTSAPAVMSVFSTTLTNGILNRITASGTTSTVDYAGNGATAGGLGTGKFSMMATVAAGTVNASDVSTVTVTVVNPV